MKNISLAIFLFCFTISVFAQKEANIWYFGQGAGVDFNTGSPVALTDGQIATLEGCASISDKDGNLLFYTDGKTVWNRNHDIMANGIGLKGNSSSTHSALIVPKPGSDNIYYIFTVDSVGESNGIQYSEVDMTFNSGLGGITPNKNIKLYSPVTEKLTAIRGCNGGCIWLVTHKFNSSEFLAYKITNLGVNLSPVNSDSGSYIGSGEHTIGAIKISPKGDKLAVARNHLNVELFDFNLETGEINNPLILLDFGPNYGIEFSPNGNVLYTTFLYGGNMFQFNLKAGTNDDIVNSRVEIVRPQTGYGALQLAPDGKIYLSNRSNGYLNVVNDPNKVGVNCDYQINAVYLEGKKAMLGLPPFIQSYFQVDDISFENTCFGDSTKFSLNDTVDSIVWNFGDPASGVNNTSSDLAPSHIFSSPGNYKVSITATIGIETAIATTTVTIYENPVVNSIVELKQCDNDLDGFIAFNLNEVINEITTNSVNEIVTFHESELDAFTDDNSINNTTTYTNRTVSSDIIWARVENNNGCFRTSQVNLGVTTTQIPNIFTSEFYTCDDDNDGVSQFDFSSVHSEIEAMFPIGQQLVINYYRNETDALVEENKIDDITNYRNIGYPVSQQIYVRIDSELDNDCLGLGAHINLFVEPIPITNPVTIERRCDDDQDGMFPFGTSQIETTLLDGQTDVTVTYFDESNNPLPSPLPDPFLTSSQIISIRVTNNNVIDGSCYNETTLEFLVDKQPIANSVPNQVSCDDGSDDTDGLHDFDTSLIENIVLNGQTGMEVHYFDESGAELLSPLPNPFLSESQTITVKVVNPINISCYDTTTFDLIVNPLPEFSIETPQIVCSSDTTFTITLDPIEENSSEIFDYKWIYHDGTELSNNPTLTTSKPGTYSITLTKTDGTNCSRTRDVFVNASELATISPTDITVVDNSDNNSITINTTSLGQGEYEFALEDEFFHYQDDPFFENVSSGIHTLLVRDKKGCGISSIDISVIGYPKFFTPNNDGVNEYWQIQGVEKFPNSVIYIFDKFGKALKKLTTNDLGWDGTYNGKLMDSSDYWFTANLGDGRNFKGHFSLIR